MTRILIIDDEKSIRKTLSTYLSRAGYEVEMAEDGQTALNMLANMDFDIVLSDIVMPQISGMRILQSIAESEVDIPVIMMTGDPTVDTAIKAVRAGAYDYLTKPIEMDAILRVVRNAAKMKALEDENRSYRDNLEKLVQTRTSELEDAMIKLKKAQEQLIEQERMSALTQMASGIAHDFNNVLMPIFGFSDLLLSKVEILDDREETLHMLEMIRDASEDAKHIVKRLRQVYKRGEVHHSPQSLAKLIESVISITMPKWKEEMNANGASIEIDCDFDDVPDINGDKTELREVFTNLILNATDAMPSGGRITFHLRTDTAKGVTVEVSDTGTGMDQTTLLRCVEPFFTTKGVHGSGLGMAIINGIVERHGGSMQIDSSPGKGTTIRLHFPTPVNRIDDKKTETVVPHAVPPVKVLVIDDEARSRTILKALLEADGHTVDLADSGQAGLAAFNAGNYDLVLTDRAMPGISGIEVARQISKTKSAPPVVMVTGFGDIMKDQEELPEGVSEVVSKPVELSDLRQVMAEVLHGTDSKEKR